jgi:Intracellular proteinase inhibitor
MPRHRAICAIAVAALSCTACSEDRQSPLTRTGVSGQVLTTAGVDGQRQALSLPARGEATAQRASAGTPMTLNLRVTPGIEAVTFELVANNSSNKRHEVRFTDGQEVEFVVRDARGRDVWTWSDGRLFTQPMRTHLLEQRESRDYEATWQDALPHGTFTAIARFRSENHPATTQVVFTLP